MQQALSSLRPSSCCGCSRKGDAACHQLHEAHKQSQADAGHAPNRRKLCLVLVGITFVLVIDLFASGALYFTGGHWTPWLALFRILLTLVLVSLQPCFVVGASSDVQDPVTPSTVTGTSEEQRHPRLESSFGLVDQELDTMRRQADVIERSRKRLNLVFAAAYVTMTAQSLFAGIEVIWLDSVQWYEPYCVVLVVLSINSWLSLFKRFMAEWYPETGVYLPGVHEHRLFYQKTGAWDKCKLCRERPGTRTGGMEGFMCRDCDDGTSSKKASAGGKASSTFWICVPCYKLRRGRALLRGLEHEPVEGILRGDKGPKEAEPSSATRNCRRVVKLVGSFWLPLITLMSTMAAGGAQLLLPKYQGTIFNNIISTSEEEFGRNLSIFIGLSAVSLVVGCVQSLVVQLLQYRVNCRVRCLMFESLVKQDIAFFDGTMIGELTSRMTNDVTATAEPLGQVLDTVLQQGLLLIGGGIMCWKTSWQLTILAVTLLGPVIYLTGVYARWSKGINLQIRISLADANSIATEALRNIRTVRSFGAADLEVREFNSRIKRAVTGGKKDAYASAGLQALSSSMEIMATLLTMWYGGQVLLGKMDARGSDLTVGSLITFSLYWKMLNKAQGSLSSIVQLLVQSASAAQRVFEIIDLQPDILQNVGDVCPGRGEPVSIEFQNLHFRYQTCPDRLILQGVTFSIPAGQTVAVVGRSGGGKSTLMSMLLRFYDPQVGQVLLNKQPLPKYNLKRLQQCIGVVSQDTQVFCRPVLENLCYGMDPAEVSLDAAIEAAKFANAHNFIMDLQDGYDSIVGEGGTRLSGGQRQRLAIARAVLRRPSILLLDEATSALDAESEGQVQNALEGLVNTVSGKCTVMVIAHRLSTVMGADKIVVIDGGKVVEEGSHTELLANGEVYANLVRRQLRQKDPESPSSD